MPHGTTVCDHVNSTWAEGVCVPVPIHASSDGIWILQELSHAQLCPHGLLNSDGFLSGQPGSPLLCGNSLLTNTFVLEEQVVPVELSSRTSSQQPW